MTKALYRLGLEFCEEVERLAPKTRPPRIKSGDVTASSLQLRATKLRARLEKVFGDTSTDTSFLRDDAQRILEEVDEWRARGQPADLDAHCALVRERGELFLSLWSKSGLSSADAQA